MRIKTHELLDNPPDDLIIWRYQNLAKFLDLIINGRLFFTNMMNLTDQYEASLPVSTIDDERDRLAKTGLTGRDLEEEVAVYVYNSGQLLRDLNLVNSWSSGESESYALWKIYVGSGSAGAAIRSTVSRLRSALENGGDSYPEDVYIGKIQYRDLIPRHEVNRFSLMTTKKTYYRFENEIRACILHYPRSEGGIVPPYDLSIGRYVRVNPSELIDAIYVSPFAGKWFGEIIESILARFNPELVTRLKKSDVNDS